MSHKAHRSAYALLLNVPFSIYNKGGAPVKSKTGKIRREIPNESKYIVHSFINQLNLN